MTGRRIRACPGLAIALLAVAGLVLPVPVLSAQDAPVTDGDPPAAVTPPGDEKQHQQDKVTDEVKSSFLNAVMMLHAKEYDYAVTALHRVLELAPRMPEAHVNMGFALLGLGQPGAARDFFLGAIDLRPRQANAYWGLAVSLEALCDKAGAIGAMRSYIHLTDADDPFLPRARAALWEWEAGTDGSQTQAGVSPVADAGCTPGGTVQ